MNDIYMDLRAQLKPKFVDYLKADHIAYFPPELTVCPHCRAHCSILFETTWSCPNCKKHGDIVDYVMANNGLESEEKAIRHLCRMLGIKNTHMEFFSANEVMDMQFSQPLFVVEKLISKGLHILAGPSKAGKSWLALWMAHRITLGKPIWDFKVHQGEVLYMCLEDPLDRVQRRLVDVTDGSTGNIWICTESEMMGCGFEEQLTGFLREHPKVNFVLIDTLQKIRDMKSENYSYAGDYRTMTTLKGIADRFGIAIVLIHHTRKAPSSDPFDMVSGTTGLMGCADSTFVMLKENRLSNSATLDATGRDIENLHFDLRFSDESMCWECIGSNLEQQDIPKHDKVLQLIRHFMDEQLVWSGTASELVEELKKRDAALDLAANVLVRIMNAHTIVLRNYYKVGYCSGQKNRKNNVKYISLKLLLEPLSGTSDITDVSDIIEHIEPTGSIEP